jgi:hypothetical protein
MAEGGKMMDQSVNTEAMSCHPDRQYGALASVGRFLWHLAQMVVAMQVGMAFFHAFLCARLYPYPLLHELVMDFYMVAPMMAVMVWHGHRWLHSAEMSAAMLAGPLVVFACVQFNAVTYLPWVSVPLLHTIASVTMYLGMLAAMLYRRVDYA